jgi:hypothetical protein
MLRKCAGITPGILKAAGIVVSVPLLLIVLYLVGVFLPMLLISRLVPD